MFHRGLTMMVALMMVALLLGALALAPPAQAQSVPIAYAIAPQHATTTAYFGSVQLTGNLPRVTFTVPRAEDYTKLYWRVHVFRWTGSGWAAAGFTGFKMANPLGSNMLAGCVTCDQTYSIHPGYYGYYMELRYFGAGRPRADMSNFTGRDMLWMPNAWPLGYVLNKVNDGLPTVYSFVSPWIVAPDSYGMGLSGASVSALAEAVPPEPSETVDPELTVDEGDELGRRGSLRGRGGGRP